MVLDGKLEYGTLKLHRELKNERGENKQVGANSGSSESHCFYCIIVTDANQVGLFITVKSTEEKILAANEVPGVFLMTSPLSGLQKR